MSTSGTAFTDWEQVETDRRRPLLIDEDFSWSEPPSRRRRSIASDARAERRRRVEPEYGSRPAHAPEPEPEPEHEHEHEYESEHAYGAEPIYAAESAYRGRSGYATEPAAPAALASGDDTLDVEREFDTAWGGRLSAADADTYEVVPYSFAGEAALESSGRRTVVISGRGAANYSVSRRRAEAGLAFHERSGFNPDRMAMWAVLLGIALLLGCIVH